MQGQSSIEAALFPAETDFFYFLATPEGDVLFSKLLMNIREKSGTYSLIVNTIMM